MYSLIIFKEEYKHLPVLIDGSFDQACQYLQSKYDFNLGKPNFFWIESSLDYLVYLRVQGFSFPESGKIEDLDQNMVVLDLGIIQRIKLQRVKK